MKLFYYNSRSASRPRGNFGDEFNTWLWPQLVGDLLSDRSTDNVWLVGIGTILNEYLPTNGLLCVLGSGFGYGEKPAINQRAQFYCVRGPVTARVLGLPPTTAVTDGALFLRLLRGPATKNAANGLQRPGFMPHYKGPLDQFREVCFLAGVNFIDPCEVTERVMQQISECSVLVAEAMHGAIVADALRVPWIPARTWPGVNAEKWLDWAQSMEVDSGFMDIYYRRVSLLNYGGGHPLSRLATRAVARWLRQIAYSGEERLSDKGLLELRLRQLAAALERLRRDVSTGDLLRGPKIICCEECKRCDCRN